jgi:hypothetical protein
LSQIRVDKTAVLKVDGTILTKVVVDLTHVQPGGRIEQQAMGYYKNVIPSDINLAYFDNNITRGIAIDTKQGLAFVGDDYGYIEAYADRTERIRNSYIDTQFEGALRDAQFSVIVQPIGRAGMQFNATDLSGKQWTVIRDANGNLRSVADGYEGQACGDGWSFIVKAAAARGLGLAEVEVQPKNEEKWMEQRTIALNN